MFTKRDLKVAPGRPLCSRRRPVFMRAAARPHAALLPISGSQRAALRRLGCNPSTVARHEAGVALRSTPAYETTSATRPRGRLRRKPSASGAPTVCRHGAARPRACGRSAAWTAWAGEPAPMRRRREECLSSIRVLQAKLAAKRNGRVAERPAHAGQSSGSSGAKRQNPAVRPWGGLPRDGNADHTQSWGCAVAPPTAYAVTNSPRIHRPPATRSPYPRLNSSVPALNAPALQRSVIRDPCIDPARAIRRGFLLPERRLGLQVVHQELTGSEAFAAMT